MSATIIALIVLLHPLAGDTLELGMNNGVRLFLERNQLLKAEKYGVESSRGELTTASTRPNPQLSVNASYIDLMKPTPDFSSTQMSARIDQTFELGGKRSDRIAVAEHSLSEATDEFENTSHNLVDDFKETFLSAALAEKEYQFARESFDIFSKLKDAAEKRLAAGDIGGEEFTQLRLEELTYAQHLSEAEQTMTETLSKLRESLDFGPSVPLKISYDFSPVFELPAEDSLRALAETQRGDLHAERERVREEESSVRLARANGIPDLDVGIELDRQGPEFKNMVGGGLGIAVPLFDRNQGAIQSAEAEYREGRFLLTEKEIEVKNEVHSAYMNYVNSLEVLKATSPSALADARHIRKMAVESYSIGSIGLVQLLETEKVYTDAVDGYYNALYKFSMNRVELERAVGIDIFSVQSSGEENTK